MSNQNAHKEAIAVAESARQITKAAAGNNQAAHRAADVVYLKAVLASGRLNGVATGALNALHNLGDPAGESGQAGDT
jgi:hypothetical protein